jgi:heme-degrading monooxygenase HmoA
MFVQIIHMQAPIGEIANLRRLVAQEYLPALRNRPGFISAHLLEQIDNRDNAELVIYWDNHDSVEDANRTGVLAGSDSSIAARMPGLRIRRQSYIIKVAVENEPELQLSAV